MLALWHRCRAGGGDPWLRIGAWSHLSWGRQLDELQAAFFRHHLQPLPADLQLRCRVAVQDSRSGVWLELDPQLRRAAPGSAAPPACEASCWRLAAPERLLPCSSADATATTQPSGIDGGITSAEPDWIDLVHDPWRPVPGRGGHLGLDAGPCERGDLDARNDVIGFTSPALERPLPLEGQPLVELVVMADQPGFDLCLALSAVSPCGRRVQQLCTGVARQLGGDCLEPRRRQVSLQPLWTRLWPGERLRLSIAAAAWPQIAVNPGSGEPAWGGPSAGHRVITLSIRLADARLRLLPLSTAAARADWGELAAPA
ncbi:CocE/NonD family hydrolase C-terminal non-catalytic domain-containing protein [Synechococcus sp. GFB01]|uniref:CocE/NonD family hydrolase C-terminal non-catalytic domain-containing protein n=1 Tax=Synechococcus sp. GFB01 TaxID=1662190 RepID=UPI00350F1724